MNPCARRSGFLFFSSLLAAILVAAGCKPPAPGPWHPEISFRPRLLYLAEEEAQIRERILRPPYDAIYAGIRQTADRDYHYSDPSGAYDHANEPANANIAKACAFVYAMEGLDAYDYADKAADILVHLQPQVDKAYNTDLPSSEALAAYCQAFDTLLGAGYDEEETVSEMKSALGSLAGSLYTKWILENTTFFNYWLNNHQTKVASAIGTAAITLNQDPRATDWINYGVTVTDLILNRIQASAGGGCGEGTNYYVYSAVNHLPFMWAFHRFLGGSGETFSLRLSGPFMLFDLHVPRYYPDFFSVPMIKDTIDWLIKLRLPDGLSPNFDDANMTYRYNGMFGRLWDNGVYSWDWIHSSAPYYTSGSVDMAADLICTFDDTVAQVEPEWSPTQFMPAAGNAVFRSDWGPDATYMLLMGEHGNARVAGFGHEHPDPMSLILYARGEPLVIDGGYINWAHHDLVNQAKNHSLVLVDGKGPPLYEVAGSQFGAGSDAYIEAPIDTPFLDHCQVRTRYASTRVRRGVIFAGNDHFFVYDHLAGCGKHTYDWLLHGNALEDFVLEDTGGVWKRGQAQLKAFVTSTRAQPTMSSYEDVNATSWGDWEEHAVLKATVEASTVKFLSVLYPCGSSEDPPEIEAIPVETGQALLAVHRDDGLELAYTKEHNDSVFLARATTGLGTIGTDAAVFYLKAVPGGVEIAELFLKGCGSFVYAGEQLFESPASCDLALRFSDDLIDGYILPPRALTFRLRTGAAPASVTGSGVTGFRYPGGGVAEVDVSGPSSLSVVLPHNPLPLNMR